MRRSVGQRARRSVPLALADEAVNRGLAVLRGLIVARLVVPDQLGRFALVLALIAAIEVPTRSGLIDALIHHDEVTPRVQRTVWWSGVARSVAVAAGVALAAPLLADIVGQPDLVGLLRLMSLEPLLAASAGLGPALAQRRLDYGRLVLVRSGAAIVGSVLMVLVVLVEPTAEGLVIGSLAATLAASAVSYLVPGFRPGFNFDLPVLRRMLRFARWRFASSVAYYVATSVDDLALGRWRGPGAVGLYRVAFQIGYLPAASFTAAVTGVAFPAFAEMNRDRLEEVAEPYLRYLRLSAGAAAAVSGALAALAAPLVAVVLGPPWERAVPALVLLTAAAFLRSVAATGGALFLGVGRSELDALMQWVRAAALVLALPLILSVGLEGAALASLLSMLATMVVWRRGLAALGVGTMRATNEVLRRLPAPFLGITSAVIVQRWTGDAGWQALIVGATVYAVSWVGASLVVDRPLVADLVALSRQLRDGVRDGQVRSSTQDSS